MIHTLRCELANSLALLAWAIAPRTGISTSYELPSIALRRRTRITRQWTTDLRTTIRSFLFKGWLVNTIASADMALSKLFARCRRLVARRRTPSPSLSQIILSHKGFRKAYPETR